MEASKNSDFLEVSFGFFMANRVVEVACGTVITAWSLKLDGCFLFAFTTFWLTLQS